MKKLLLMMLAFASIVCAENKRITGTIYEVWVGDLDTYIGGNPTENAFFVKIYPDNATSTDRIANAYVFSLGYTNDEKAKARYALALAAFQSGKRIHLQFLNKPSAEAEPFPSLLPSTGAYATGVRMLSGNAFPVP